MASGLNLLLGFWLVVSPFVLGFSDLPAATANGLIVGVIVAALAASRAFALYTVAWFSWVNVALGIWLILSPFLLGYAGTPMSNSIIVGAAIAGLGIWSARATRRTTTL